MHIYILHGTLNQNIRDLITLTTFSDLSNTTMPTLTTLCITGKLYINSRYSVFSIRISRLE